MVQALQLAFVKLSILFFYRRIFCGTKGTSTSIMNIVTWAMIALTIIWGISFFFANLFQCGIHWTDNWSSTATLNNDCIKTVQMNEAYFISDFLIDFIIFVMPIYKVRIYPLTSCTVLNSLVDRFGASKCQSGVDSLSLVFLPWVPCEYHTSCSPFFLARYILTTLNI
jgi:hypothetical protein